MSRGFVLTDFAGERDVRDDEVISMALQVKRNYANGLLRSLTREFVIWLTAEERPERLVMTNTFKAGAADPIAGLIQRLGDRLHEQARADRDAGRSVLGERWSIEAGELSVRGDKAISACRVEDVVAVDSVDDQVCIWRRGQDAPFARVPGSSANAYLLGRLLGEELARRPRPDGPPTDGQLGRIIFERRPRKSTVVVLAVLAALCLSAAAGLGLLALANAVPALWAALFVALAGVLWLGAIQCRRASFRCHEYGVFQSGLRRTRTLRYADVGEFTYSAVRHFHHGAYTGTAVQLTFQAANGEKADHIRYRAMIKNADRELDNLRDAVSTMIAARMRQELDAKRPVRWTPRLRFLPEGIEYQAGGAFRRPEPVVVPYREIASYNVNQGTFLLWVKGRQKPVVREGVARPNFFPGFLVLASLGEHGAAPVPPA
jgi:hypothetical protein